MKKNLNYIFKKFSTDILSFDNKKNDVFQHSQMHLIIFLMKIIVYVVMTNKQQHLLDDSKELRLFTLMIWLEIY